MKKPTAIDLFSGCGGLTLGLRRAGFRVIGAVEIDPLAAETYRANHPSVLLWESDISKLSAATVLRKLSLRRGELDLLAGCPPCQGFSRMTTLNGRYVVDDPRNDLVFQFMRFVRSLRPKAIMLENVPALGKDQRIKSMIDELVLLGYGCSTGILDASDYGVPQRRRRFILLAGRRSAIPFARPSRRKRTVREAFRRVRNGLGRDPLQECIENRSAKVKAIISRIPKNGGSRRDLDARCQLKCHQNCDGFNDVYGRMAWDSVAPTITGGFCNPSKGRFLHPTKNRTITLREGALLQSFPSRYFFSLRRGKFSAAQMIGNALPPEFVHRQAVMVRRFLEQPLK